VNERTESVSCVLCGPAPRRVVAVKPPHTIVRCERCGLCYAATRPAPVAMADFYDHYFAARPETGYEHYRSGEGWRRGVARGRVRLLSRYAPKGRLLDHGCATGIFLREAAEAGWDVLGVEASAAAREVIAREAPHLKVIGPDEMLGLPRGSVDAITMFDNFCYLHDPLGALRRFRALLRPGGVILSIGALDHAPAHRAPEPGISHTFYYAPGPVDRLCRAAGLRLLVNTTIVKNANLPWKHPVAWAASHVPGLRNLFFRQHFFVATPSDPGVARTEREGTLPS
jgi:SAM-dependent methyltransferase